MLKRNVPNSRSMFIVFLPSLCLATNGYADVIEDSHMDLTFRNFYMNRNFVNSGAAVSEQRSWSQGVMAAFTSGYTDTSLAIGLDLNAQYALRLDSSGNDGSIPYDVKNQQTVPDYGRAGATFKARYSKSLLRIGDMQPKSPVLGTEMSRQLPSIAQGAVLESKEFDNVTLTGGRYWSQVTRESSDRADFFLMNQTKARGSDDGMDFFGVDYKPVKSLQLSYYHAVLHDIYTQNYLGLEHRQELGNGYKLATDVRYHRFAEEGDAVGGAIDNHNYGISLGLSKGNHLVGVAYQRMLGETGFPQLSGNTEIPYLVNWSSLGFLRANERSWSARYVYDLAGWGIPGGRVFTRYIKGTQIDRGAGLPHDTESETNLIADYTVQNGPLKNLTMQLRYIPVRQNYGSDTETFRFYASYTWRLW